MKKRILLGLLLLLLGYTLSAERKKVGVVLSGGGAKGVAHIGVLKALDEAGIPVDYVVGTSMGSIIGGLYAIGYSPGQLDSLVRVQDWEYILSNRTKRNKLVFSQKDNREKYLLSIPLFQDKFIKIPAAMISGQNIFNLLTELTIGYHDSISFHDLPIPFACMAANLVNGEEVVLDKGNLAAAMRASMAIPGVFNPVYQGDMVLVDGGIANNFPVDLVKKMGADIVIGVDVTADLRTGEHLNSTLNVINQMTSFLGIRKYNENVKLPDLYIKPDIVPYSAASFEKAAIDTLIRRGEEAARHSWDKLLLLKKEIGLADTLQKQAEADHVYEASDSVYIRHILIEGLPAEDEGWVYRKIGLPQYSFVCIRDLYAKVSGLYGTGVFSYVNYRLSGDGRNDLTFILKKKSSNTLNFGFRFDSEVMAAVLLNMNFSPKKLSLYQMSVTGRLSMNPYIRIDNTLGKILQRQVMASYMYKYNDLYLYHKGKKRDNLTFSYHMGELNFSDIYVKNLKFQLGVRYEYFHINSQLSAEIEERVDVSSDGFFSYFVLAHYESMDKKYYPTRGVLFEGEYSLYTTNGLKHEGSSPFSALYLNFRSAISLNRRMTLLPSVYGRVLIGDHVPLPYLNYMGGTVYGRYFGQQLPFIGIDNLETFEHALLVAALRCRYRISKHYMTLALNYAKHENNFFDLLKGGDVWGGGVSYSYDSRIGPLEGWINLSNWDKKLGIVLSLGYHF